MDKTAEITFGAGAEEAFVTVASRIPYGCTIALLGENQQVPSGSEPVAGIDVSFIACIDEGVVYANLNANGDKDGTVGLRPWADIAKIHVY